MNSRSDARPVESRRRAGQGPWRGAPRTISRAKNSFDRDRRGCAGRIAVVADPFELERAALLRDREERQIGIGRDRREEIGAKNLGAVVAAREARDDVARDQRAVRGMAEAGLHDVRGQRADLDDFAASGFRRNVDERGHQFISSVQAASVTTISVVTCQNVSSERRAIATTFWVSASRIRVEIWARPEEGPRWKLPMFGCGFFSLKTWMLLT